MGGAHDLANIPTRGQKRVRKEPESPNPLGDVLP